MRTTIDIDDDLLLSAREFAPELTKTALIEAALQAFMREQARKRIAAGALHQADFKVPPRRKVS